jgi:ABC-type nitrate/sulfonate/bicarbonate transport system substrate-binding protein
MPSSHITSTATLAGKTIAVNLTSNIQTLMTNVQLKSAGVSPSRSSTWPFRSRTWGPR